MKFKELKESTIDTLQKMLKSEREKARALRFSINSRQEKNVRNARDSKKTIAKILTILNSKNNATDTQSDKKE